MKMKTLIVALVIFSLISFTCATGCPPNCQCNSKWECEGKNITNDELKTFKDYGDPSAVDELLLQKNLISYFPVEYFVNFTSLRVLDLGENLLTTVPKNISAFLPSLNTIKLQRNKISIISADDFIGYGNIIELDFYSNQIEELPPNIFSYLKRSERIILAQNQISKLYKNSLKGLKNLVNFTINGNRISDIPEEIFEDCINVEVLWLSNNPLTNKLPKNLFSPLKAVYELRLRNSLLDNGKLADGIFGGIDLDSLDLQNNSLSTVKKEWFNKTRLRHNVFINGNPIVCNCHLYEAYNKLYKVDNNVKFIGTCVKTHKTIHETISGNRLNCTACSTNKCQNNATCKVINEENYKCICSEFYHGRFCDKEYSCILEPCLNNGTCISHNTSHFTCNCTKGYFGDVCQKELPCFFYNPCLNNGICQVTSVNDYVCNCMPNFKGKKCEKRTFEPEYLALLIIPVLAILVLIVFRCRKTKQLDRQRVNENTPFNRTNIEIRDGL